MTSFNIRTVVILDFHHVLIPYGENQVRGL